MDNAYRFGSIAVTCEGYDYPDVHAAVDAAGWTYGLAGADYARLLRRT